MTQARKTLDLIQRLRGEGAAFCVATVIRTANLTSAKAGAKAVVTQDGEVHGFVGGGCVIGAVRDAARNALECGKPRMICVRPKEEGVAAADGDVDGDVDGDGASIYDSGCPSGGTVELFIEPFRRPRRLVICGASPVAQALVTLARTVGFEVIVAALKSDHEIIPGADGYLGDFDLRPLDLQPEDSIVIATQGKRDREALRGALSSPARYLGMVGSRRKIAKLKSDLAKEGAHSADRLDQLKGPAGLDIGAIGPEEIALAIAVEVVAFLRQSETLPAPSVPTAPPVAT